MQSLIFLPLALGTIGILQGALNRSMISSLGLLKVAMLGSIVTLIIMTAVYMIGQYKPELFPSFFRIKSGEMKWWFILPGIFGFLIVSTLPISIFKLGAVKTTVGLIAAQMITSVVWDIFVEGISFTYTKGAGVIFALVSVVLITFFK
jgi:transporter family-2 protein